MPVAKKHCVDGINSLTWLDFQTKDSAEKNLQFVREEIEKYKKNKCIRAPMSSKI